MSSNWSANKPPAQRERFASPLAVCGLIGAGLLLLLMLYPEKELLKLLSAPSVTTPAQQRYLEILVHLRSDDADLALTLARSYLADNLSGKAESIITHLPAELSPRQAKTALTLQYEARRQKLKRLRPGDSRWPAFQQEYAGQVEKLVQAGATPAELGHYLADAKSMGDKRTTTRLEALLQKRAERVTVTAPERLTAESALAKGDYRAAAAIRFQEMKKVPLVEKRKYFLEGVRILQSGNLLVEALAEAEKHLAPLADDRETLMFLSRLALAANRPDLAQYYIRRALGIMDSRKVGA